MGDGRKRGQQPHCSQRSYAFCAAIPALMPRVLLPGSVLEIILGAILGPQILGSRADVWPGVAHDLFNLCNLTAAWPGVGVPYGQAGNRTRDQCAATDDAHLVYSNGEIHTLNLTDRTEGNLLQNAGS